MADKNGVVKNSLFLPILSQFWICPPIPAIQHWKALGIWTNSWPSEMSSNKQDKQEYFQTLWEKDTLDTLLWENEHCIPYILRKKSIQLGKQNFWNDLTEGSKTLRKIPHVNPGYIWELCNFWVCRFVNFVKFYHWGALSKQFLLNK